VTSGDRTGHRISSGEIGSVLDWLRGDRHRFRTETEPIQRYEIDPSRRPKREAGAEKVLDLPRTGSEEGEKVLVREKGRRSLAAATVGVRRVGRSRNKI